MYNYRRKNIIMIVMVCMVMFMAVGYALLSSSLNIKGISDLTGAWDIKITNVVSTPTGKAYNITDPVYNNTTMTFNVGVKVPGDKMTFSVTVTNAGNIDAKLSSIDATVSGSEEIIYKIEGIKNDEVLEGGTSKTFTVSTEFDINATSIPANPVKDLTVTLNYIQYDDETLNPSDPIINETDRESTLAYIIRNDNTAIDASSLDYTKSSKTDGTNGLYYTSTNTENNGTTYFFRGPVENNYVSLGGATTIDSTQKMCMVDGEEVIQYVGSGNFSKITDADWCNNYSAEVQVFENLMWNGKRYKYLIDTAWAFYSECPDEYAAAGPVTKQVYAKWEPVKVYTNLWRIVRINEDESVRLIKDESIGSQYYHAMDGDNARVGYMYGSVGANSYLNAHQNTNNSAVKTFIDSWYEKNLIIYSNYLEDTGFCNDRTKATTAGSWNSLDTALGYGTNVTYYAGYNRWSNKTPTFVCNNSARDLFTTKNSSKGNKALDYPIGMITMDEMMYSGILSNYYGADNSYLMGDSTSDIYWTMTPFIFGDLSTQDGPSLNALIMTVGAYVQTAVDYRAMAYSGIRPVINLKRYVEVLSGNGTKDDPYVIGTKPNTTLVSQILADNDEEYKENNITLSIPMTYTPYNDGVVVSTPSSSSTTFTSGTNYYFGTDYVFDPYTGKYQVSGNVTKSIWNNQQVGKYTCLSSERYNWCSKIYKISSYSNATTGYAYPYTATTSGINYTQPSGLFYTSENTENNKTTYYFRGDVENNYVRFAGIDWRIVRINEDGSIRLITRDSVGTSYFGTDSNAYVGYMYGAPYTTNYKDTHKNTNDSKIKDYVDSWYEENLITYSNYLADAGFCNDRSIAPSAGLWYSLDAALGYGTDNYTYYGPYHRLVNLRQPQFACPQTNDLFTTSTSNKGNKALTYPIGLITADEVQYSGGSIQSANGDVYWTMSPYNLSGYHTFEWRVNTSGSTEGYFAEESGGVRPVINLKSNVEIISGNGTSDNPYVIKTN